MFAIVFRPPKKERTRSLQRSMQVHSHSRDRALVRSREAMPGLAAYARCNVARQRETKVVGVVGQMTWSEAQRRRNDFLRKALVLLERAMGIEPTSEAWEASILPLYDARSFRLLRLYLIPRPREKLRARILQKPAVTNRPARTVNPTCPITISALTCCTPATSAPPRARAGKSRDILHVPTISLVTVRR